MAVVAIVVAVVAVAVVATVSTGGGALVLAGGGIMAASSVAASATAVATAATGVAVTSAVGAGAIAVGQSIAYSIGSNGTQTSSETTWNGKGKERLDVENPNPGGRDGQIHFHDPNNKKYMYDFSTNMFRNPSKRLTRLMSDPKFRNGLNKALKILGEECIK